MTPFSFVLLGALWSTGDPTPSAPVSFEIEPLPVPMACSAAAPNAINAEGQVALVCSLNGGQTRSYLWDPAGIRRIGTFGTGFLRHEANDLNDRGEVAGSSWAGGFPAAAWEWDDWAFAPLDTLGGANAATFAINESGVQTGWSNVALPQSIFSFYACLWDGGRPTNLGELPEATRSCGNQVNAQGRVAGTSTALGRDLLRAMIADTTLGMHDLGTLGGLESWAFDLNDAGEVVGRSDTGRIVDGQWAFHAFLWREGVMHDLGTLPGEEYSGAVAINATGEVAGWSRPDFFGGATRAVLWRNGVAIDLNTTIPPDSGWLLVSTADINDAGLIVGTGFWNGQSRPFVLTPNRGSH